VNNIQLASGIWVATDEIASIHYQKMKLIDGSEDGITPAIVSGSGGLRVDLATALDRNVDSVGIGLYNGSGHEAAQGNNDRVIAPSAARTVNLRVQDLLNVNGRGVILRIAVTVAGTGSIKGQVWGQDPDGVNFWALGETPNIVANGYTILKVYPGIPAVANVAISDVLPRLWMVQVVHNNANPITYSVGASLMV
jgi:hypothetical protein